MVYLSTSEDWQQQTSLLLQARPTTTRITTKYNIPNLKAAKYQRIQKRERDADKDASAAAATDAPRIPRATLTLKTYDPESGVVLKFKTDRAADVGRLVGGLGRVGRVMAALPERAEAPDKTMEDAAPAEHAAETVSASRETPIPASDAKTPQAPTGGGGGGGGGGKKKKKGKK